MPLSISMEPGAPSVWLQRKLKPSQTFSVVAMAQVVGIDLPQITVLCWRQQTAANPEIPSRNPSQQLITKRDSPEYNTYMITKVGHQRGYPELNRTFSLL